MIRYLYIPENFELDEHIEYAVENNFQQVIHGPSDIIKDLIYDENNIQEINIPEYTLILNESLIFEENQEFIITIVDEFNVKEKYQLDKIIVYRKDDFNLNKKSFIFAKKITKNNDYYYEVSLKLDKYGLYEIEISAVDSSEEKFILIKDEIIIYKKYEEENVTDDKFFFS